MTTSLHALQTVYDSMWQNAEKAFASGNIQLDQYLQDRDTDMRRGLTVIARLKPPVITHIAGLLDQLRTLEPHQYYYRPEELHITVLSLFSATAAYDHHAPKIPRYVQTLPQAFSEESPFDIDFVGITASPSAVMVQGFPQYDRLNRLRDTLRQTLHKAGLGDTLDTRYRIVTAHVTIMRFCQPLQDQLALLELLAGFRTQQLGCMTCHTVQWVKNDWYMSTGRTEVLEEYRLLG